LKSFKEWVEENHPDDEVLNEFLGKDSGVGKAVRAAALAGALAFGSGKGADAAMPMVPNISQEEGFSKKTFNRDFILSIAEEMGASRNKLEEMDDWNLWHWQQRKITRIEHEMYRHNIAKRKNAFAGQKEWPMWYIKFGTYYGWKTPAPPKHPTEVK
jgi:hypothetical protein